jgi:MFS superfamily sulfate permease-like transporter
MLTYHVAVPLAVVAVLVLVGVDVAGAIRVGIAAGCVSMVVMMATGGMHHGHRAPTDAATRTENAAKTR